MQRLAKRWLITLRERHPEVKIGVERADEHVARAAPHAKLVPPLVPRGEQVRLELLDGAQVRHQAVVLLGVVRPDDDAAVGARGEQLVGDGVPLQRVHVRVVL